MQKSDQKNKFMDSIWLKGPMFFLAAEDRFSNPCNKFATRENKVLSKGKNILDSNVKKIVKTGLTFGETDSSMPRLIWEWRVTCAQNLSKMRSLIYLI